MDSETVKQYALSSFSEEKFKELLDQLEDCNQITRRELREYENIFKELRKGPKETKYDLNWAKDQAMTGIKVDDFIEIIDKLENEGVLSRKLSRDLERQFV